MKPISGILLFAMASCALVSCELDNYNGPDAQIYGSIIDIKDGSLVQQDIARGTQICYQELGYDDPKTQYMIIKETGEYRNDLIFSGRYDFFFNESNFVVPEKLSNYRIQPGNNRLDFTVQPYIRISGVSISRENDGKIVATFSVTPTVDEKVQRIALFGHLDRVVGDAYAQVRTTQDVGEAFKDQTKTFTLELDVSTLKQDTKYWFRVGAIIEKGGARYNYAPAVRIGL